MFRGASSQLLSMVVTQTWLWNPSDLLRSFYKTKQNTSPKKPWLRIKFSIPDPGSKKLVGPESVFRVGFATDILGFPHTWNLTSRWKKQKKKKKKFFYINVNQHSHSLLNHSQFIWMLNYNFQWMLRFSQSFTTLIKIWIYSVSLRKMLFSWGVGVGEPGCIYCHIITYHPKDMKSKHSSSPWKGKLHTVWDRCRSFM